MHMSAVAPQPGELTLEEIRTAYPVAIDSPPMLKPSVMPDRVWIAETTAEVQPASEWHAPLLYPNTSVSAPVNRQTYATVAPGTPVMEIGIIPPWVWVAATVGLVGLLLWRAR